MNVMLRLSETTIINLLIKQSQEEDKDPDLKDICNLMNTQLRRISKEKIEINLIRYFQCSPKELVVNNKKLIDFINNNIKSDIFEEEKLILEQEEVQEI